MHKDEDLHRQLMVKFREYFEENQRWFNEDTYTSTIRLRHLLSDIRHICSDRRKAIRLWQVEKRQKLDERKLRRAQKKAGIDSDTTT